MDEHIDYLNLGTEDMAQEKEWNKTIIFFRHNWHYHGTAFPCPKEYESELFIHEYKKGNQIEEHWQDRQIVGHNNNG